MDDYPPEVRHAAQAAYLHLRGCPVNEMSDEVWMSLLSPPLRAALTGEPIEAEDEDLRSTLAQRETKRCAIGIRVTPSMRRALLEASRESGRSLTQEIEFRLEATFLSREIAKTAAEIAAETVAKVLIRHGLPPAKED